MNKSKSLDKEDGRNLTTSEEHPQAAPAVENTHTKSDTTDEAQSKTIYGVFMFGCAAIEITKNRSSLPALQELPSPRILPKLKQNPEGGQYHGPELASSR